MTEKKKKNAPKKEARSEILRFRVTPAERERIENKAYSSYRIVSKYLRDCALGKEIFVVEGVDSLARELRRIGTNLNQIAKAVNAGNLSAVDLTGMTEEVRAVWQSLNSLPLAVR